MIKTKVVVKNIFRMPSLNSTIVTIDSIEEPRVGNFISSLSDNLIWKITGVVVSKKALSNQRPLEYLRVRHKLWDVNIAPLENSRDDIRMGHQYYLIQEPYS